MRIFVVSDGEKTKPNKANLFSPQTCAGGLKKQSQFSKGRNECKPSDDKLLWGKVVVLGSEKQSQSKPILRKGISEKV